MKKRICLITICLLVPIFMLLTNDKNYTVKYVAKNFNDPLTTSYMKRIDINFDTNKLRLSPAYTYLEAMSLFERNWTYPDGVHYRNGGNVYFAYCPFSSLCEYAETERVNTGEEYYMAVKGDRYHWVEFEVQTDNCEGYDEICPYDFDEEHLDQIEVYVNGTKITNAIVDDYNDYWHLVRVRIPYQTYTGVLVKNIKVTSPSSYVERGTTSQFSAEVNYYGAGGGAFTWSVIDNESNATTISQSGLLTVASDEPSGSITVRATSNVDGTVYDEKEIFLLDEPIKIYNVTIDEEEKTVVYGGVYKFTGRANGTASPEVSWSLTGANKAGTTIASDGTLTVAENETATSVVVTATSVFDNTKSASLTVTLRNTQNVHKIEISYDTEAVVFSTRTTYGDARSVFEQNWSLPENVGYSKGSNNIWFRRCETQNRCDLNDDDMIYITASENMAATYTYAVFEIFAKPSGRTNETNPEYDFENTFDANGHIENIEIWVNGVKRNDAFAANYNESWRMVHVFVPITVTNDKLAQSFDFDYDEYYDYYGSAPFNNHLRNRIGDGAISYVSSNPAVASVDSAGNVTINKIGTCTITVTASETANYKEYVTSYPVTIDPLYINPTVTGYNDSYTYQGSPITPEITVTYNDIPLVKDVDYTVTYNTNTNYGSGFIYINPVDGSNYTFEHNKTKQFWIAKKDIAFEDITLNPTQVAYDGTPKEVAVTVIVDGRTLTEDVDYQVSYFGNTTPGIAYARITGIGNYDSIQDVPFTIGEFEKGDMNKNGKIDLADVILLLRRYLNDDATEEEIQIGDMDESGSIGLNDIIALLREYLKS